MSVKGRVLRIKRALSSGGLMRDYPWIVRTVGYILYFLLGLLMSSARVLGVCGPFGIGIVGQAGAGISGVCCLVGASVGYLWTGSFDWGLKYVSSVVLVFTASFVFQQLKIYKSKWFMPAVTAVITAGTSFLNSFDAVSAIPAPILITTEVILAGGCAYFFALALSNEERDTEAAEMKYSVSILILVSCALMALSQIYVLDVISVGRFIAVLLVMTAAYKGSLLSGSAAGAALGLAMDISYGGIPFYTMAYAFAGLLSGVFSKHGRLLFVLSYILANGAAVLWTWGNGLRMGVLYEVFASSVVFMILPGSLLNYVGGLFQQTFTANGESGLRKYSARRISRMSQAFRELYETVHRSMRAEKNDNDIATVFDRAADQVCSGCARAGVCWQEKYVETLSVMNGATQAMESRGRLEVSDLPAWFTEKCPTPEALVSAVNLELRGLMYRRQYKSRLSENRAAAYGQFSDLSDILGSVAWEISAQSGMDPLSERRLLRYLRGMDIEAQVSVFRDRGGRLRATIESARIGQLTREPAYLDKLSTILGVRLCRPSLEDEDERERLILMEAEPLSVSVGIAARKKKGEPVSGDRGTYFKTDQGLLCIILSDGMGSGEDAAKESIAVVKILEQFLRSGVEPGTAIKILNSVMLLRNGDDWGYATVDLVCINLFTGEAAFYKYGAAPSYVRSGKMIRRIRGESMAAGLYVGEGFTPDVIRMRLKPGSMALIASDGVLAEEDDVWLRALLSTFEGTDTKTLAKEALQGAIRQYGCEDDMTVLAVYVDKRA